MLKIFSLIGLLFLAQISPLLAESDYNISGIPVELKKDAVAVIRKNRTILEIQSPSRITRKIQYAITILNEKGKDYGNLYVGYDNLSQIRNIDGNVYSKDGTLIRKIKNSEIRDQSYYPEYTLYDDSRVKYIEIFESSYPYTVEYECEIEYNGMAGYPIWQPVSYYNISVEQSVLEVILSPEMNFHYKECNLPDKAQVTETENGKRYHWEVKNISAPEYEPFSPSLVDFTPVVYLAPDKFYYDGFPGDMSTWATYGSWTYNLIKTRDDLPIETVYKINSMVSGIDDEKQKVKIIYEYMQSKTRYVSIQLGIGGFQPFPASDVDKVGYGDCKALSNYTRALLSAVGIKSFYTEIGSGTEYEIKFDDFSSTSQTNHVILCVPMNDDTIWLECTNQKIPFGFISQNISDRKALLITEEGGKIVKTTRYPGEINSQLRTASIILYEDKHAEAKINTVYSGLQYDNIRGIINGSNKEQKDHLYQTLSMNDFEINEFNYYEKKDIIPEVSEKISLNINNWGSIAGNRLIIPLNLLNRWEYIPDNTRTRKTNIVFRIPYYDSDTVRFNIPQNYTMDFLPVGQKFVSDFGEYLFTVSFNDNIITYSRNLKINKGVYPPEKYGEFVSFFTDINRSDNCKAILIKE